MHSVPTTVTTRGLGECIKVILVKCLAPTKGSNTCSLKNKMRAWFQGCQGLLDHQTVSIPHKAASRCYAALRPRVSARAGGFSQHLRREHSGSGKSILEANEELVFSSTGSARPLLPPGILLLSETLIFQPSVRWSGERRRGWEQKK